MKGELSKTRKDVVVKKKISLNKIRRKRSRCRADITIFQALSAPGLSFSNNSQIVGDEMNVSWRLSSDKWICLPTNTFFMSPGQTTLYCCKFYRIDEVC